MPKPAGFSPHLSALPLARARPTQISVGMAEVEDKRKTWKAAGRKARQRLIEAHLVPVVMGPEGRFYIIDHHHFALALLKEGARQATAIVQRDFSMLGGLTFWRTMEYYRFAHPYDEHGERVEYANIPHALGDLRDDRYRALAAFARYRGAYAKETMPYAEFLWADFFRSRMALARSRPSTAEIAHAVHLAASPDAAYLPGWSGEHRPR